MADRRGFGAIRQLPSGRYQASYVGPDGRRRNAGTTFGAEIDAEGWLARRREEIRDGVWQPGTVKRRQVLTVGAYADQWLPRRTLTPRTRAHYGSLLEHFIKPTLGAVPITSMTPALVAEWHHGLATKTGPTYRAHAYSLLRTILNGAVADELLAANPCRVRGAGNSKRVKKIQPATLAELETIVLAMPERLRAIVLLASWCALRFGELTELRRKDVDLTNGIIKVRRGVTWVDGKPIVGPPKSAAGIRDVAIPPHLLPTLRAHIAEHAQPGRDGLLFPGADGGHLTDSALRNSWYPARDAAGRADLRFHDLRHTGAVLAAQTGATLAELMARLGHSTPAAAMRYQHAAKDRDAEIARLLSEMVATRADG